MFFSMLGSIFSGRKDFTAVKTRKPVQTEPYESDCPGFNTRFSFHDIDTRVRSGRAVTAAELQFYTYITVK